MAHPPEAIGAILSGTALDELERRDEATVLIARSASGGMGITTVIGQV